MVLDLNRDLTLTLNPQERTDICGMARLLPSRKTQSARQEPRPPVCAPRTEGLRAVCMFVLWLTVCGCGTRNGGLEGHQVAEPWFEDVTEAAGINFVHRRGETRYWLPEIMSGGAAWIDYDQDGSLDIYLVQGGDLDGTGELAGNELWRNQGDGTFRNVTLEAGVGDTGYEMGVTVGDYDSDGDPDLYVTNVGANVLYRNRGNGTFEDVTSMSGVGHNGWGTAAAFIDHDQDGDQDLFLVNYIHWSPQSEIECRTATNLRDYCSPQSYQSPAVDVLYRNRGNGTFDDVSDELGISTAYGNGLGVTVADFNRDSRLDFYVANDGSPNQLWLQDDQGRFHDRALESGCSLNRVGAVEAGMGVAAIDLENDGDVDLFMSHLDNQTNTLYVNEEGRFEDRTAVAGLAAPSLGYTGFGLGFVDFNHDQHLDLFVANGRVGQNLPAIVPECVFAEPNQLFQGDASGRFAEVEPRGGTSPVLVRNARAAAFGDYDRDGDVDILIVNNGSQAQLLENHVGENENWIRFRVIDRHGHDSVGAMVQIKAGNGIQWRSVGRVYSYLSSNEPSIHFGLGGAKHVSDVQVVWPSGKTESFGSQLVGDEHELREGAAVAGTTP